MICGVFLSKLSDPGVELFSYYAFDVCSIDFWCWKVVSFFSLISLFKVC